MRTRGPNRLAHVLTVLALSLSVAGVASAAEASGTIKLQPAATQVASGGTVSVKVISNSAVAISGVSASLKFDKAILQVTTITRAAGWSSAPLFLAADAKAITTANQKGVLQNVAAAFFPPGSVPSGDQEFITVEFKAVGCGTVNITVPTGSADSSMLDGRDATYGVSLKVTTTGATITACEGGGPVGSQPPGASGAPIASDGASPLPGETLDPNATATPSPGNSVGGGGLTASPTPSAAPLGAGPASSITSEQSSWLTFAMGTLAIAAAGLAVLILLLVLVAILGLIAGGAFLFRLWRRGSAPRPVAVVQPDPAPVPGGAGSPAPGAVPGVVPGSTPTPAGTPIPVGAYAVADPAPGRAIDPAPDPTLVVSIPGFNAPALPVVAGEQPLPATNA